MVRGPKNDEGENVKKEAALNNESRPSVAVFLCWIGSFTFGIAFWVFMFWLHQKIVSNLVDRSIFLR